MESWLPSAPSMRDLVRPNVGRRTDMGIQKFEKIRRMFMKKVFGSNALTLAVLILMLAAAVPSLHAQTFYSVPGLSFTKTFAGANPLPQVLTAASNGANFNSTATASTNSGGNWLVLSPASGVHLTPAA